MGADFTRIYADGGRGWARIEDADLRGLKRCVFRLIRPPIPIDLAAYSGDSRPFAAITAGACPHDVQDVVAVSIPSV